MRHFFHTGVGRFFLAAVSAISATVIVTGAAASTGGFKGKLYDRKNREAAPIYLWAHDVKEEGASRQITNTFTAPDGKPVAVETAEFTAGRLQKYEQKQLQLNATGKIEVKDGKVNFTYEKDGQTKTASEKLKDNFVVGPSLVGYVEGQWAKIIKGDDVDVRLGVVDRRETVGFTFRKVKETDYHGQKAVVVKMKPTSFVIAALVDPLLFTFTADGTRVLELDGRTIPKRADGGKFKDLDVITVYEYP